MRRGRLRWGVFLVALASTGAWAAPGLRVTSAALLPDRLFPHLIRYCVEGSELREEAGLPNEFADPERRGAVLHLFVRNQGREPVEVKQVLLDGLDLSKHLLPLYREHEGLRAASFLLNDPRTTPPTVRDQLEALGAPQWYQVRPNPVPAGGIAQVTVRLRRLPRGKTLSLAAGASGAPAVGTRLRADRPAQLSLASVGFPEGGDRLFLYLRHAEGKEFLLRSVRLDGTETAVAPDQPRRNFAGFLPVVVTLPAAWEVGSFHHLQATTNEGEVAAAVVRAQEPFFALGMWGYRNYGETLPQRARDTCSAFRAHLFNTHMGMAGEQTGYLESAAGLQLLQEMGLRLLARAPDALTCGYPRLYARFLLDEPDVQDYFVNNLPDDRRLGCYGQALADRQRQWVAADPRTPTLLNVDLTYKPENWLVYGQLPDILAIDPYYQELLRGAYWKHPGRFGPLSHPYFVFACSEIARWAGEPRPLHVILNAISYRDPRDPAQTFRYGTPEEKRVECYYALAAGVRGISYWWFTPYGEYRGCGADDPGARAMM
ncbi:MAG: hypothetical protein QHJ73_04160, partial [Armatimonadota bacterium]|nr:hypothetical protein [Armatimonadota bacterium]